MEGDTKLVIDCGTGEAAEVPLTAEEIEARDAGRAHEAKRQLGASFETNEDAERLALVRERAATDPAYAALAELALKGVTA